MLADRTTIGVAEESALVDRPETEVTQARQQPTHPGPDADETALHAWWTEPCLTGREEGAAVGRSESVVSRKRQDPGHPANTDPRSHPQTVGQRGSLVVPRDAALHWWANRPDGRKKTRAAATTPDGLTPTLWAALQTRAAGGDISALMTRRLTDRGMLTVTGGLTGTARALLTDTPLDES